MTAHRKVQCHRHGLSEMSFVCIHIGLAMDTDQSVGFFWFEATETQPAIAWCDACEKWLIQHGETWNDDFKDQADFKLVCSGCYESAKKAMHKIPK